MAPNISYLEHRQIDKTKWDHCIEQASNTLIYPNSWYLDQMADNWDALVAGDYEWVMPLTFRKKLGIKYLYQPAFTQQLGIFGKLDMDEDMIRLFIKEAGKRFSFAEIFLNMQNRFSGTQPRNNFILNLDKSYATIEAGFKEDLRKNVKRSKSFGLLYHDSSDYLEAIHYYRMEYSSRISHLGDKEFGQFTNLCRIAFEKKMLLIRKVDLPGSGLLAIILLLRDSGRLYNIMSTTLPEGRRMEANHFLFEQLIREFANNNLILDFEGSDIEGIARFYQKFGAVIEPYFYLRYNKLAWPLKYLKK